MKMLKTIIGLLAGTILKDVGDAFDKNFTSKEEKLKAIAELEKKYNERLTVIASMTEDPDSWLSKNVRPLCILIALSTLSVVMLFDIQVNQDLVNMYAKWTGIMVAFYFGAREIVKFVSRKKNR